MSLFKGIYLLLLIIKSATKQRGYLFDKWFFYDYQNLLLEFANTSLGRYFFKINGGLSSVGKRRITMIAPNFIQWDIGKQISREFRSHDKFSKRLYYKLLPVWYVLHAWDTLFANNFQPSWNLGFDTTGNLYPAEGSNSPIDGILGRIGVDESFASIRSGAGTNTWTIFFNSCHLKASSTNNQYSELFRAVFCFDTSSIQLSSTVTAASLTLYSQYKAEGLGSFTAHICKANLASTATLATTDYANFETTSFGSVASGSWRHPDPNDNVITLNSDGLSAVNKTGVTQIGMRTSWDINNSTTGLTWVNGYDSTISAFAADQTGTASDPYLVVTYTPAATSSIKDIIGSGIIAFPR